LHHHGNGSAIGTHCHTIANTHLTMCFSNCAATVAIDATLRHMHYERYYVPLLHHHCAQPYCKLGNNHKQLKQYYTRDDVSPVHLVSCNITCWINTNTVLCSGPVKTTHVKHTYTHYRINMMTWHAQQASARCRIMITRRVHTRCRCGYDKMQDGSGSDLIWANAAAVCKM
jgi:hypothetical protein